MAIPVSLLLIAVGAILTWAVQDRSRSINLDAVGIILMVVGFVGLLLALMWWERFGLGYWRRGAYVEGGARPWYGNWGRGRRVVEEESSGPPGPPSGPPPP
jgi:hypothetical protein